MSLSPKIVPIEQERNLHNLNDETHCGEAKQERLCDWLLKRGHNYDLERPPTYSDVTRHTQEGSIHQKTVWRNDYDSSLETDCDTPFLTDKSRDWLSPNSDSEEESAGTPIKVRGVGSWDTPDSRTFGIGSHIDQSHWDCPKITHLKGDLFQSKHSLAHSASKDIFMSQGIANEFRNRYGSVQELEDQKKAIGEVAVLQKGNPYSYYLVAKEN